MTEDPTASPHQALPVAVRRSITIDAPAEAVWDTLTAPEALRDWLGLEIDDRPTPGAVGRHREDDAIRQVLITEVVPGRTLQWHWTDTDGTELSTVSIAVEANDQDGVVVTVVETLADRRGAASACSLADAALAWDHRLADLRAVARLGRLAMTRR